jgi:hypothetical protein
MVNLDKWEKIEYDDIKQGDKLLKIVEHKDGTRTRVTGVAAREGYLGWASKDLWSLVQVNPPFAGTVYRRKPKPYKLPTGLGATVQAIRVSIGSTETFMLADPGNDKCSWVIEGGGSWLMASEVMGPRFRDHVTIFKGI